MVGAGLVGLAVGRALAEAFPGISILLLEKEPQVASHQSGRNSGVVHSGLYYRPGSLKARLCVEGRAAVEGLGAAGAIPYRRTGKLVIATHPAEMPALDELEWRGRSNGLAGITRLGPADIAAFEPEAVGLAAIHVPEAGVADFGALARLLLGDLLSGGAVVVTGHEVTAIDRAGDGVTVTAGSERFDCRVLVNCAGLHSDRVAGLAGIDPPVRIVPFRGEYYRLSEEAAPLVKGLVYPVPDPRFPFLGVHFTRRIDGTVEVGPNAVLALGREQYRGSPPVWGDFWETLTNRGFRRLARRHWRAGLREMLSSRSTTLYSRLARRLVPAIRRRHLERGGVGIRAQAIAPDGSLVDDFVIERADSTTHVLNAPSPGATASLAIGRYVAEQIRPMLTRPRPD